ncbi:MAG: hypothetical protein K2M43_03555 [Mycoplasmoidaceae bacterium]|nr:hypothetical protein [Mycoplasmoidaceae bacterium]
MTLKTKNHGNGSKKQSLRELVIDGFNNINKRLDNVERRLDNVERRLDNVENTLSTIIKVNKLKLK